MLKNITTQADSYKFDRRFMTLSFMTIGALVVLFALAVNIKFKSELDANAIERPLLISHKAQLATGYMLSFDSYLQNIALAKSDEQRDTALITLYAREKSVSQLLKQIVSLSPKKQPQAIDSQKHFQQWKNLRTEFYQRVVSGEQASALLYLKNTMTDYLWELEQKIEAVRLNSEQNLESLQSSAQSHSNHFYIVTLFASVAGVSVIGLLLFNQWRQVNLNNKYNHQRQALLDEHVLLAVLDSEGRVTDVSSAIGQFFGRPKSELLANRSPFLLGSSKRDRLLEKNILNALSQGKAWRGEVAFKNSQGSELWAECAINPSIDQEHQEISYSCILHDLTSKKLANIDKLTGLLNRRSYDEILTSQLNLAVRNKYAMTLAILDIDFFKRFNDSYGHPEGDIALRRLGELLTQYMQRANDYAFRIGGEEFALIVSGLDKAKVELYLNTLRKAVKDLQIENENSSVSDYLSVSIGAVILEQGYITEQKLYKAADKALYQAKTDRDKVVVNVIRSEKLV